MADGFMDQIEHVIVLMMENRSLDNLAGWLYEPDSEPQPRKIIGRQDSSGSSEAGEVEQCSVSRGSSRLPYTSGDGSYLG